MDTRAPSRKLLKNLCLLCATSLIPQIVLGDPIAIVKSTDNGSNGSFETLEAGKKGNSGQQSSVSNVFTIPSPQSGSTTANTPGYSVKLTGGKGGNGGSSACCNGGEGGGGGSFVNATLTGTPWIGTAFDQSPGVIINLKYGNGGDGGESGAGGRGGTGGTGSQPSNSSLNLQSIFDQSGVPLVWNLLTLGNASSAVEVVSTGGDGGKGGTGATGGATGGEGYFTSKILVGGTHGSTGVLNVLGLDAQTQGSESPGLTVTATAGNGGQGGANDTADGGQGGNGGRPSELGVSAWVTIQTTGDSSPGINVASQGGTGGKGGTGKSFGSGGPGGSGGGGGEIAIYLSDTVSSASVENTIVTSGSLSHGVVGSSIGGVGGTDGDGSFISKTGAPGAGSASGAVNVDLLNGLSGQRAPTGSIKTFGDGAVGIYAQSIGGHGGNSSSDVGLLYAFSVNGGSAGDGGTVTVQNGMTVQTTGNGANAISAHSIGGGGGSGGNTFAIFYSGSGDGGNGGDGKEVVVHNAGELSTQNYDSSGIHAQSVGGAGGSGGSAGAIVALGGRAGNAAAGGKVTVTNSGGIKIIKPPSTTVDPANCVGCSYGILAQSIGGGGGKAGSNGGWVSVGGTGGGGGDGSDVSVVNSGSILTQFQSSSAIFAQSVGGGGGTGAGAFSAGVFASAAVGGSGGSGGNGAMVTVENVVAPNTSNVTIATNEDHSHGIAAQSIGGGGGHGGYGAAVAVGFTIPAVAVGVGASGGGGGDGAAVSVTTQGNQQLTQSVSTLGDHSYGVLAKSIGGGGGTGGASIAGTLTVDSTGMGGVSVAVGGSGGAGGNGGTVDATIGSDVTTSGLSAPAVAAMSIGGGGGGGGLSFATSVAISATGPTSGANFDVGVGGKGAVAGDGAAVTLNHNSGNIKTSGDHSEGLLAQSVGGGGGRGATSVAAGLSTAGVVNFSMGGGGGVGGDGGSAVLSSVNSISTGNSTNGAGDHSPGILSQSVGGGGGHGGLSISAALTTASSVGSLGVSIGGSGGAGGGGSSTAASWDGGQVSTVGDHAPGIAAQSLGGGGGNGGLSIAGSIGLSKAVAMNVSVGGSGGAAGDSVDASGGIPAALLFAAGAVSTQGQLSPGLLAQSIGGGGGNGGLSIAGTITLPSAAAIQVSVGGSGAGGGNAGSVLVCNDAVPFSASCPSTTNGASNAIATAGASSHGILAQSIGGGGGHSGLAIAGAPAAGVSTSLSVGGNGGSAGTGGKVNVYSSGSITTTGQTSNGILAQSVGGAGGAAYVSITGSGVTTFAENLSIGGSGGNAAGSSEVIVTSSNTIKTTQSLSDGIVALSTAGSGGVGGMAFSGSVTSTGNLGFALGGGGGTAGSSGVAEIAWAGDSIITEGDMSIGLFAHSSGGSGGRGGMVADGSLYSTNNVLLSIGGAGGSGGVAGDANIEPVMSGSITTSGAMSPAMVASSMGGNGGRGGAAIATTGVSQIDVAVTLGGGGGTGGTAGDATAGTTVSGVISTTGPQSEGIFSQSLGGHGGVGGWVAEGGLTTSSGKGNAGSLTVNLGGSGGTGGTGGQATGVNLGSITTSDFSSAAVFVQSIGGDGGQGGAVYSGQINLQTKQTADIGVNVGGAGGAGGTSAKAHAASSGNLTTMQSDSAGLFAQSVGGSGGKGGATYNVLLNLAAQSESSQSVQVVVGGAGGGGAIGGEVLVENKLGIIKTNGESSVGMFGQSIGGNGGVGGAGGNMLVSLGKGQSSDQSQTNFNFDIAVGGAGGTGAHASTVGATSASGTQIATTGAFSHGMHAQSVGGGGGVGGAASGYKLNIAGACSISGAATFSYNCRNSSGGQSKVTLAANVNIGGSGGAGGDGGVVTASNVGAISTDGDYSYGVFVQSIGGGGGAGGNASTGLGAFTSNKIAADIATILGKASGGLDPYKQLTAYTKWSFSVGGTGGASGTGDSVSVDNQGSVATTGHGSHAILAQSVGGGGGAGGSGSASPVFSLSVGGQGAGGGDGGAVSVTDENGNISSTGVAAYGILAQSVGGGGGATGDRKYFSGSGITTNYSVKIGGSDGVSGNGNTVTIETTGTSIKTQQSSAIGIFAQSIGGGGGLAIGGANEATGVITVGGDTNASGNGGPVLITNNGSIGTGSRAVGDVTAAHGIFAQSIGGGGGYGGAVAMGSTSNFGANVISGTGGDGDGGFVSVNTVGNIQTDGGASAGIFAQSVGGGGGVSGNADNYSTAGVKVGSAGGTGKGGAISITYGDPRDLIASTINTSANGTLSSGAHGIFAQSVGGTGSSTTSDDRVWMNLIGSVKAPGPGSFGVFAQSVGDGMGAINVNVSSYSTVEGGGNSISSSVEDGAAIFIKDGFKSSLENQGVITAGSSGIAVNATSTDLVFTNTGTVTGTVLKASSATQTEGTTINVDNRSGGVFEAGKTLNVDTFDNAGTLVVALKDKIGETNLTGQLLQTPGGAISINLDFGNLGSDVLRVGGTAGFGGRVEVEPVLPTGVFNGSNKSGSVEIVTASGGLTLNSAASVRPSAAARYRLFQASGTALHLGWDVDFSNVDIQNRTVDNQNQLTNHLQKRFLDGTLFAAAPNEALGLLRIENTKDFAQVVDALSGEMYLNTQLSTLYSAQSFGEALISCSARGDTDPSLNEGACFWFDVDVSRFDQDRNSVSLGFTEQTLRLAGGAGVELASGTHVGFALAYEDKSMVVGAATSDGETFQIGVFGKRQFGSSLFSASLSAGVGQFDTKRRINSGVILEADQKIWNFSGQLGVAHEFEMGNWTITPRLDLRGDHISSNDLTENPNTSFGLQIDGGGNTFFSLKSAVEIAGEFERPDGTLIRSGLTLGLTQFLDDDFIAADTQFSFSSSSNDGFVTKAHLDRTYFDVSANLTIVSTSNMSFEVSPYVSLSNNSSSYGTRIGFEYRF